MDTKYSRRLFIQTSISLLSISGLSLLSSNSYSKWPDTLFNSEKHTEIIHELLNGRVAKKGHIEIKVPEIADRGEKVPVSVSSDLNDIKSISVLVDKNPRPFMSKFFIYDGSEAYVSIHIKMKESSKVYVLVETENDIYIESKNVKVTAGGC